MGNKVPAAKYLSDIRYGIHSMDEVLEFTNTQAIGLSRADDEMRQKLREQMTPFEKKQEQLNDELRKMKNAAIQYQENKSKKDYKDVKVATQGRKDYKAAKKDVTELYEELQKMVADKQKEEEAKGSSGDHDGAVDLATQLTVQQAFKDQIDQVDGIYDKINKNSRDKREQEDCAIAVNELGQMDDLDPMTWEHVKQYHKNDEEIDKILEEVYKVNIETFEIAKKIGEEGKKQDPLVEANLQSVQRNLVTAKKAKKRIEEVKEMIVGKGPGRICIYMVIVILIIAVAYGIYTLVNGEDPCAEYNDQACTGLSN